MTADTLEAALTLHRRGDFDGAIAIYERLAQTMGDDARVLRYLGLAQFAGGHRGPGLACLERAVTLAPDNSRCWSDLGRMHAHDGRTVDARVCFERAVAVNDRDADAWHNLGRTSRQSGDTAAALEAYRRALSIDPGRADTYLNLGNLLVDDNQTDNAIESFRRAAELDPRLAQARRQLAAELSGRGDVGEAEFVYRQAIALAPDHVQAWFGLGRVLEDLGNAAEAADCYRRVLAMQSTQPWALGQLLGLVGVDVGPDLLATAERSLDDDAIPERARALIGYGLGKALDRDRQYGRAYRAFHYANMARRHQTGAFDRAAFDRRVDALIEIFDADFFVSRRRFGIGTDAPVFIIGMPRSGTTLTEQILSSHPLIHGAGELPYLSDIAMQLASRFDLSACWPACATGLTQRHLHACAHDYLERLRASAPDLALRISDKAPLNFFHLGLAALMFPNARIVHCRRDPLDTALSIYFENFRDTQTHAADLSDIAAYYRGYRRLMTHWHSVLPNEILEVAYEETVSDIETQARRLVAFADLPWDARCLNFHRHQRAVQTPSRWQVRQPIYGSSVGRWRHYPDAYRKLRAAFAGTV